MSQAAANYLLHPFTVGRLNRGGFSRGARCKFCRFFYRSSTGDINFIGDRARYCGKRSEDTAAAVSFLNAEEADVWTI